MTKEEKRLGIEKPKHRLQKRERIRGKRKPRKDKRSWEERFFVCPFCGAYIPPAPSEKDEWWKFRRLTTCSNCQAFEVVNACPSCRRTTWYLPDDGEFTKGEYRHVKWGGFGFCSFRGRKLNESG